MVGYVSQLLQRHCHNVQEYYSGMQGSDEQLAEFIEKGSVIISTPALAYGLDTVVDYIAYLEEPYSMTNLVQSWGRAGRNGLNATCKLYSNNSSLLNSICLRVRIAEYYEQQTKSCLETDAAPCSNCLQKNTASDPEQVAIQIHDKDQHQQSVKTKLKTLLSMEECLLCTLYGVESHALNEKCLLGRKRCYKCFGEHAGNQCQFRSKVVLMAKGYCYNCGMPASPTFGYHTTFPSGVKYIAINKV